MLRSDSIALQKDKLFYQECKRLLDMLLIHTSTSDFSRDFVKKILHGDIQRLNQWIQDELTNIDSIEKGNHDGTRAES